MAVTSGWLCLFCSTFEEDVGAGEAKVLQQSHILAPDWPDVNPLLTHGDNSLLKQIKFHL